MTEYTDGVFITWEEYKKAELNENNLQEEIRLLRVELEKYEKLSQ